MGLLDSVLGAALGAATGGGQSGGGGGAGAAVLMQVIGSLLNGAQGGGGGAGAGGAAGGLGALLQQLQQGGLGEAAQSWVSTGENQAVSGEQLQSALGADRIEALAQQAGLPTGELAGQLAQLLPQVVDRLTPDGQLPAGAGGQPLDQVLGGLLGGLLNRG